MDPKAYGKWVYSDQAAHRFAQPKLSDWQCDLFGSADGNGIQWRPLQGCEPNRFWRWMQFICFGNRWSKIA